MDERRGGAQSETESRVWRERLSPDRDSAARSERSWASSGRQGGGSPAPKGPGAAAGSVRKNRPAALRRPVNPDRPYAWLTESEPDAKGRETRIHTLFLTGRECPFRCVMCDLWRNSLPGPTPPGAIPRQIRWALAEGVAPESAVDGQPGGARAIKLYNSANFFDPKAVPAADLPEIASLCRSYDRVVVENHPKLTDERILRFRDLLAPHTLLEVAMGIETVHPAALARLRKSMDLADLERAARFCVREGVDLRGFLLLHAPPLGVEELRDPDVARKWTLRGVAHAGALGFGTLSLVPLRPEQAVRGAGLPDSRAASAGAAAWAGTAPDAGECERTLREALALDGRPPVILLDLWDLDAPRDAMERLRRMNRLQRPVRPS